MFSLKVGVCLAMTSIPNLAKYFYKPSLSPNPYTVHIIYIIVIPAEKQQKAKSFTAANALESIWGRREGETKRERGGKSETAFVDELKNKLHCHFHICVLRPVLCHS